MNRGYYVLIAGVAIFIAGIVIAYVAAIPVFQQLQKNSQMLSNEPLTPGASRVVRLPVSDSSMQITVAINSQDQGYPLHAVVAAPDGSRLIDSNFNGTFARGVKATTAGTYVLTITNIGSSNETVNAVFGNLPAVQPGSQFNFEAYGGLVAGTLMTVVGVIVMIVGGVITVLDWRRKKPAPPP